MTFQVGIHLEERRILAALVDRRRVVAVTQQERGDSAVLAGQLQEIVRSFHLAKWRRVSITIAVGHDSRSKRLIGLPPLRDQKELELLIQENSARFFVGDSRERVVAAARSGDEVIAESYDRQIVASLATAAIGLNAPLRVVSAVSVLAHTNGSAPRELSEKGADYLVAVACARLPDTLAIPTLAPIQGVSRSIPRWRSLVAIGATCISGLFGALAPVYSQRATIRAARSELSALSVPYASALREQQAFSKVSNDLFAIAQFQQASRSAVHFLESLNQALPEEAALAALAIDSAGGSMVVLAPSASEVLNSLDSLSAISAVRLTGAVTPEKVAEEDFERATIRFSWSLLK